MATNLSKQYLSEYTDTVNFSSTGADVEFGFNANTLRLRNDAAKSVYFTLRSTTGATTSGHELKSSEEFILRDQQVAGFSFVATSSAGSGVGLRVGAWGD